MGKVDVYCHVLYALRNATIKTWPFPHFFVSNVFPDDFYATLTTKLREKTDFAAGARDYEGRKFASPEDFPELEFMNTKEFLMEVTRLFTSWLKTRFQDKQAVVFHDLRLIRDPKNYHIGPHTDAVWKLVSLLFYLPEDLRHVECGTSIYIPKNRQFRCEGGPHHPFEWFDKVYTAPYVPNSCFWFFKTNDSFHGVEPLADDFNRDVLLYNVYDQETYLQTHKTVPENSS
jgi:hypothetical protein